MNLPQIKRFALRALLRMDGTPMPDAALRDSIEIACARPAVSEVDLALNELESVRLISRADDPITGRTWTLTTAGEHKARQL